MVTKIKTNNIIDYKKLTLHVLSKTPEDFEAEWRKRATAQHAEMILRGYEVNYAPNKRIKKLLRKAIKGSPNQIRKAKDVLHRLVETSDEIVDLVLNYMPESYLYVPGTENIGLDDLVQNRINDIYEKQQYEQENDYSDC